MRTSPMNADTTRLDQPGQAALGMRNRSVGAGQGPYSCAVSGSRMSSSRRSCSASSVPVSMPGLELSSHAEELRVAPSGC